MLCSKRKEVEYQSLQCYLWSKCLRRWLNLSFMNTVSLLEAFYQHVGHLSLLLYHLITPMFSGLLDHFDQLVSWLLSCSVVIGINNGFDVVGAVISLDCICRNI